MCYVSCVMCQWHGKLISYNLMQNSFFLFFLQVSCVMCHVSCVNDMESWSVTIWCKTLFSFFSSCVMCYVSCVMCQWRGNWTIAVRWSKCVCHWYMTNDTSHMTLQEKKVRWNLYRTVSDQMSLSLTHDTWYMTHETSRKKREKGNFYRTVIHQMSVLWLESFDRRISNWLQHALPSMEIAVTEDDDTARRRLTRWTVGWRNAWCCGVSTMAVTAMTQWLPGEGTWTFHRTKLVRSLVRLITPWNLLSKVGSVSVSEVHPSCHDWGTMRSRSATREYSESTVDCIL
jgi:hypothetical protein